MSRIKIIVPKKYQEEKERLEKFIKKDDPLQYIEKLTRLNWKGKIEIRQRKGVSWKGNTIYFRLSSDLPDKFWGFICHEFSHMILRQNKWYNFDDIIKATIKKHRKKILDFTAGDFQYTLEQTLAVMLDITANYLLGTKKELKFKNFESYFKQNYVYETGKLFWNDWLDYFHNPKKYKDIRYWISHILKKHDKALARLAPIINKR